MKIKLYQTSLDSKPITFLTFEGPKEVETLEVAATLAKRNCFSRTFKSRRNTRNRTSSAC